MSVAEKGSTAATIWPVSVLIRLRLGDIYSVSRVQGAGAQARIHSYKRLGDGEPASGPESLLYPVDPIS